MIFFLFDFDSSIELDVEELIFLVRNLIVGYGRFTSTKMPSIQKIKGLIMKEVNKHGFHGELTIDLLAFKQFMDLLP